MAIPVDKAPAPYQPPKPRPGEVAAPIHTGSIDDIRGPGYSGAAAPGVRQVRFQANLGRGCALAVLLGVGSMCAIAGVGTWMLVQVAGREYDAQALRITGEMRDAAEAQGRMSVFASDLSHFDELVTQHEVSIIATAALVRRYTVAKQDGVIDEAELDRLMQVVSDAAAHDGVVDPARYPEAGEMP